MYAEVRSSGFVVGNLTVAASKAFCLISSIKSSASENAVRYTLFSVSAVEFSRSVELKRKEISEKTYVSQEEVENYYKKRQISEQDLPPLREIEAKITKELKEKKKIGLLRDWIIDLRKNAKIEINEEILVKN